MEWRPVVGYEGHYEVSKCGRVRSVDRRGVDGRRLRGRPLIGSISNYGYRRVHLSAEGSTTKHGVHQLVARAFLGPVPEGKQVNHIDGDKLNNRTSNLQYVTSGQNTAHAVANGLRDNSGENNHCTQLTESQVLDIRRRCSEGDTQTALAREFGVTQANISRIVRRETWKHI